MNLQKTPNNTNILRRLKVDRQMNIQTERQRDEWTEKLMSLFISHKDSLLEKDKE